MKHAAPQKNREEKAYAHLTVQTDRIPPGQYPFVIYRWAKREVKQEEKLVVVSDDAGVEDSLFELLKVAQPVEDSSLPSQEAFEEIDARHYSKWVTAQANHIAENRQLVEYRQSLTVSHQARRKVIEEQLARATNEKIQLMKQSELARADADYSRRIEELERAADSGDIHATPVTFGLLLVR